MSDLPGFAGWTEYYASDSLDVTGLQAAMLALRDHLASADNLGQTRDARDFYALIDRCGDAVPGSACRPGCASCCQMHHAMIRVFEGEWEAIAAHLEANLDAAGWRELARRFEAEVRPRLGELRRHQDALDAGDRLETNAQDLPIACPFLERDRCGVYPARPAICRAYGHFELTNADERTEVFACREQRAALSGSLQDGERRVRLPSFNPVYEAIAARCDYQPKLLLPLWLELRLAAREASR